MMDAVRYLRFTLDDVPSPMVFIPEWMLAVR